MIYYDRGTGCPALLRLIQMKGSVFPKGLVVTIPSCIIAAGLKWILMASDVDIEDDMVIINNAGAWTGFSFMVGFLIAFRTSQAYGRFWDGCRATQAMRSKWMDACSLVCATCAPSKADPGSVTLFKHLLVRLVSMLHASALAEIGDGVQDHVKVERAFTLPLIDVDAIDAESLRAIQTTDSRAELVYMWIQQLLVENVDRGIIQCPSPILARAFNDLSMGLAAYHECVTIACVPFPFPYAQTCDMLLLLHWFIAPLVMAQMATNPGWAVVFTFVQVFVLWSLNFIAVEIENPFTSDDNDLDNESMQAELNNQLLLLVAKKTTTLPTLRISADLLGNMPVPNSTSTFIGAWMTLDSDDRLPSWSSKSPPLLKGHSASFLFSESSAGQSPKLSLAGPRFNSTAVEPPGLLAATSAPRGHSPTPCARGRVGDAIWISEGPVHDAMPAGPPPVCDANRACARGRVGDTRWLPDVPIQNTMRGASPQAEVRVTSAPAVCRARPAQGCETEERRQGRRSGSVVSCLQACAKGPRSWSPCIGVGRPPRRVLVPEALDAAVAGAPSGRMTQSL